jgi:hypothetical protein
VIVAVVAVRVMEVAADAVVCVITVRNRLMAAAGAVDMAGLVPAAAMVRHASRDTSRARRYDLRAGGVGDRHAGNRRGRDGGVATTRPMLVSMVGMGRRRAGCHEVISFPCPRSSDTAVWPSAAWSIALRIIGSRCSSARA